MYADLGGKGLRRGSATMLLRLFHSDLKPRRKRRARFGRRPPATPEFLLCALAFVVLAGSFATRAAAQGSGDEAKVKPAENSAGQPAAPPAQPGSPPDSENIAVRVEVVNVPVTVLDKRGLPIIDLAQEDFRVPRRLSRRLHRGLPGMGQPRAGESSAAIDDT